MVNQDCFANVYQSVRCNKKRNIYLYECSYMHIYISIVTCESRAPLACKIREFPRRRRGHRRLISASIVALCPFAVPSTPFCRRGNVPWKWFVITAAAGIRADEANILFRAILNPRKIDFVTRRLPYPGEYPLLWEKYVTQRSRCFVSSFL